MGGYFDRGASAGGSDEGYFNQDDVTGPSGVGSATGGPGGVFDNDPGLQVDAQNPNIVHATPQPRLDETAGTTSPERISGSYPDIVDGSDSERTGTSWGIPAHEEAANVEVAGQARAEGEGAGEAAPNRNTAVDVTKDDLRNVGSWSTIETDDTAG